MNPIKRKRHDKGMMDKGMKTQFPILPFLCPNSYVPILAYPPGCREAAGRMPET
jgi:hypothetical protein